MLNKTAGKTNKKPLSEKLFSVLLNPYLTIKVTLAAIIKSLNAILPVHSAINLLRINRENRLPIGKENNPTVNKNITTRDI